MSGAIAAVPMLFKGISGAVSAIGSGAVAAGGALFGAGGLGAVTGGAATGILGRTVTGALMGGAMSRLSGGSFKRGAMMGAGMGALSGISGGMTPTVSSQGGLMPQPAAMQGPATAGPAAEIPTQGLMSGIGGWVSQNQELVGGAIGGLGQGLMARQQAKDERARERRITESYDVDYSTPTFSVASRPGKVRAEYDKNEGRIVWRSGNA